MGIVIVLIATAASAWVGHAAYKSLQQREVSRNWHIAYFAAMLMGIVAGVYFGFFFRYFASKDVEVVSFPIPAVFLVLEEYPNGESRWTDFVTPAPLLFAGSNVLIFACFAVLLVWFANSLSRKFLTVKAPPTHP